MSSRTNSMRILVCFNTSKLPMMWAKFVTSSRFRDAWRNILVRITSHGRTLLVCVLACARLLTLIRFRLACIVILGAVHWDDDINKTDAGVLGNPLGASNTAYTLFGVPPFHPSFS